MSPASSSPISFPAFRGFTRWLVLANLIAYFVLLTSLLSPTGSAWLITTFAYSPGQFLHGWLWQPFTYSFIHPPDTIIGTLLELVSLWFLAGFLEQLHNRSWVAGLYGSSVLGTALAATAIYLGSGIFGYSLPVAGLTGCFGGIFGLLVAIGILYGEMEFLLFFTIGIKARHLAIIYCLLSIAMLFFGSLRMYAFAQLGGALAGYLFIRIAPRRGLTFAFSEQWYGVRNRYYRWKRHRAARKFEVYMKRQGRTVRLDGQGHPIDEDHNDKKRWN